MPDQPNILFIFTDQQAAEALSCAGNPDLQTPNLDRLAAEGVRFERAYCTYPLCTPSRASLFTGKLPHEVGVFWNDMGLTDEAREASLGFVLGAAGYDCAYGGKWHLPTSLAKAPPHGFRPLQGMNDETLADTCVAFIQEERDQPFFLVASFDNPHNICEYARNQCLPWGDVAEPTSIADCPNLPSNFGWPPLAPSAVQREQQANPKAYPVATYTSDDWRRLRWGYCRLVEKVDREVGRILEGLRGSGQEDNTVVVFSSDHGECAGAHGWNQKTILYDEAVRVPLIVRAPDTAQPGRVVAGQLVSNGLDLFPTFCDYAGVKPPAGLAGKSLRPFVTNAPKATGHDELVVQTVFGGPLAPGTAGRALITPQYKYVVYDWGQCREQLFDRTSDPGETVNLAVEARYAATLNELRERLRKALDCTGDRFNDGRIPSIPR